MLQKVLRVVLIVVSCWPFVELTPIVGGATLSGNDLFDNSFVVSIQKRRGNSSDFELFEHFCGGSLVSDQWVLTAAHCINKNDYRGYYVVVGEVDLLAKNVQRYNVVNYKTVNFNPYSLRNDIALIKIASHIHFTWNFHKVGCLLSYRMKPGESCQIVGYGSGIYGGTILNKLNIADVQLISNEDCRHRLGDYIAPRYGDNKICAVGNKTDTCQGDSGGPLICQYKGTNFIYGIVSHGINCGAEGIPSIYTRVKFYLPWIKYIISRF